MVPGLQEGQRNTTLLNRNILITEAIISVIEVPLLISLWCKGYI